MRSALAALAFAGAAAAQCSSSYTGSFSIEVVNQTSSSKRWLVQRDTPLTITLEDGKLLDSEGRTGYIASNEQFQFNNPVQANAITQTGFGVSDNKLCLDGSTTFYSCLSGTFDNLYAKSQGGQCFAVYIEMVGASGSSSSASATSSAAAESSDGQVTATPVPSASATCSEYVDGQPQCSSASSSSAEGCSEYVDGQPQCSSTSSAAECSEYVDGQPQCSSATVTSSAAECSEYVDGQPQCSSAATTSSAAACSEYSDGQPQCSTASAQPSYYQATGTAASAASSYTGPAIATGAAALPTAAPVLLGALGILAML